MHVKGERLHLFSEACIIREISSSSVRRNYYAANASANCAGKEESIYSLPQLQVKMDKEK